MTFKGVTEKLHSVSRMTCVFEGPEGVAGAGS